MKLIDLINQLKNLKSIPGIKVLQPFANFIIRGIKSIEIRTYNTKYRGILGILASGWHSYYDEDKTRRLYAPIFFYNYALIGFVILKDIKYYTNKFDFKKDYQFHLNDPEFLWSDPCYGWIFEDPTIIRPLYYNHSKNRDKMDIRGVKSSNLWGACYQQRGCSNMDYFT